MLQKSKTYFQILGTMFDCHKLVLSCQSDVFCTMFSSRKWQMLESKTGEVKIHDVKPEVMETLIYFIYHDAIQARIFKFPKWQVKSFFDQLVHHMISRNSGSTEFLIEF